MRFLNSFVSIDFETANSFRGSPCSIGLTRFVDGQIEQQYSSLIKPPPGYEYFDYFNTMLHGISEEDVEDAPEFIDLLPEVLGVIGELPLVAHNAAFDMGVIRDSLNVYGAKYPKLEYYCTLVLSRKVLNLLSYRLPVVADELDVEVLLHHDAVDDSRVSGQIAIGLLERANANSLLDLATSLRIVPGYMNGDSWAGCHYKGQSISERFSPERLAEIMNAIGEGELDPNSEIIGKNVVFTGTLGSMTRAEAQARVLRVGGFPENSVTKHTNLLVFGVQDPSHLRPGAENSSKFLKAQSLKEKGQEIEVVDEVTFLKMIRGS